MPNLTTAQGIRFSLPGSSTAPGTPERKPSGSRIRDFMKSGSIRRRPGSKDSKDEKDKKEPTPKDGVFQFGHTHSNVEFKVELDAGSESEVPISQQAPSEEAHVANDSYPYPILANRSYTGVNAVDYVPKLIGKIENNLDVIRSLHQRSLREFDGDLGDSRTSPVSHELHYYGTRTRGLCLQLTQYFTNSRDITPIMEQAQQAKAVLKQYQNTISDFVGSLRVQMEDKYRLVRPEATDQDVADALKDIPSRNFSVPMLRIDEREAIQPIIRAIEKRSRTISVSEEKLRELDEFYNAIALAETGRQVNAPPASNLGSRECIIAPLGDVLIVFGAGTETYFQVSSQSLSAVSPLFSYALRPYRVGERLARGPPPADLVGDLPTSAPEIINSSLPPVVHMPQDEIDERGALSTLLYAAHTRHDKVPRHIEFEDFVAIASVCHRYRCTAPVEIFVECFWLPQWKDKVGQGDYENFIFISYVFGLERIFELCSKKVILRSREEKGLFEGCDLPQNVWRRLNHVRGQSFRKIVEKCNATINLFLPSARSSLPGGGRTPRDSLSLGQPPDMETSSIQLVRPTRCPHGSHACDAGNLGYLMMVMNEVGVLPPCWSNFSKRSEESLATWQGYSLYETLTKLCGAPSAPNVHDGCDYAPAFRNAMCDIFNSIRGLSVRDVNEQYANRRTSQLIGVGGPAADEGNRVVVPVRPQSHEIELGPHSPVHLRSRSGADSGHLSPASPTSPASYQAYAGRTLPLSALEDASRARVEEGVHRHTLAILNERNLAAMDMESRSSIVSTEVDTRTDRCVSPSVDSIARSSTPIAAPSTNTSVNTSTNTSANTSSTNSRLGITSNGTGPGTGPAPVPIVHDSREADKIFWTQHAHKERITIADKNLLISNKHIMRIGEERGLPPIRPNRPDAVQIPESLPSPPLPTSVTTPTQPTSPLPLAVPATVETWI